MKHQVLFFSKSNEKVFIIVVFCLKWRFGLNESSPRVKLVLEGKFA